MNKKNLSEGIYEAIINEQLNKLLQSKVDYNIERQSINHAESSLILSSYIGYLVRAGLEYIHKNEDKNNENIGKKIEIINSIINLLAENTDEEFISSIIPLPPQQLLSIYLK